MYRSSLPHSSTRPAEIELIRDLARGALTPAQKKRLEKQVVALEPPDRKDAFIMHTANEWLQSVPWGQSAADKLFGDFWYQGEVGILFADTNVGKSILAVQIANALSGGEPIANMDTGRKAEKVLYFDFELSAAQFEKRYTSRELGPYPFNENFYRVVLNPDATGAGRFKNYLEYMSNALENIVITTGARILILDNITCLRNGSEAASGAVSLMRNLQNIKNRYGLSILVLAHTPKRNPSKPVTRNDLQGSKMLINFADSAFAMGESQTAPGLRYIKQIKQRSGTEYYGAANVYLCRIVKPGNFLKLDLDGCDHEAAHLLHFTEQQRKHLEEQVMLMHDQGLSVRVIAKQTGVSHSAVHRLVKRMEREIEVKVAISSSKVL